MFTASLSYKVIQINHGQNVEIIWGEGEEWTLKSLFIKLVIFSFVIITEKKGK